MKLLIELDDKGQAQLSIDGAAIGSALQEVRLYGENPPSITVVLASTATKSEIACEREVEHTTPDGLCDDCDSRRMCQTCGMVGHNVPAELDAEQAMEWLRGGDRRYVADNQGDAWQFVKDGGPWFELAGSDEREDCLPDRFAPYRPLAPVTRRVATRLEANKLALAVLEGLREELPKNASGLTGVIAAINELRDAAKEGT